MRKILLSGIVAGIGMMVVAIAFSFVISPFFPQLQEEYTNPNVYRSWSDPLMSLFFVYPFLLALILSFVWDKTKKVIEGKTPQERGVKFALWYFLVATVSGMFITYSSFKVSFLMVTSWTISGLLEAVVAGFIFAKINP